MSKIVKQFRYFGDKSSDNAQANTYNEPNNITAVKLRSGSIFFADDLAGKYIVSLRIHGTPGTKFYINNSADALVLGWSGNYILDLDGISTITSLCFDATSLNQVSNSALSTQGLIIDCIYESEG